MSLWRVKHTLSPVVEYALVGTVAAYGLFGIYLSSLRPFAVADASAVGTFREEIPLDIDAWERRDDRARGLIHGVPPGWVVDASEPDLVRLGRSTREAAMAPEGDGILIETIALGERQEVQNVAALDFSGRRPALYDVAVDGRPALFAILFERGRVRAQAVYVPAGDAALVIRAGALDPAAFAAFLSAVKFFPSETLTASP